MIQFGNLSDLEIKKIIRERMKSDYDFDNDPFFDDVARIGALLSSEQMCVHYASQLNDELLAYAKAKGVFDVMTNKPFFGARDSLAKPKNVVSTFKAKLDEGMDSEFAHTLERHKNYKVLSGFLTEFEASEGFNAGAYNFESKNKVGGDVTLTTTAGKAVKLPGFVPPAVFRQELLAKARHFKDPGVGVLHGEFTHRIQWFIVCRHASVTKTLTKSPADIFKACARPVFCNNAANTSVWDLVFEGGGTAKDFRKPEALTEYFIRASRKEHVHHKALWFLAGLIEGRYAKRSIEKAAQ